MLLIEHITLIILGVFLKRNYLVYWGIIVAVLTVMYMLRSFAYIQLGLIAISLIAYAIYRLNRTERA